jgi:hypothetical protein
VQALSLVSAVVDSRYLEGVCAAMPQLRCLDLSCCWLQHTLWESITGWLLALHQLSNLETLDLTSVPLGVAQLQHIRAPGSLSRCRLGHIQERQEQDSARAALGRHVDVVFGA